MKTSSKPSHYLVYKYTSSGWEFWFNGRGKSPEELHRRIAWVKQDKLPHDHIQVINPGGKPMQIKPATSLPAPQDQASHPAHDPSNHIIPFGKYTGRTLDQIASTSEGLRYLDWLVGQDWVGGLTKARLQEYLAGEDVRRELDELLGD